MTTLTKSKTASQLRLAAAACDLAPALYRADCLVSGIKPVHFGDLSMAQQRIYVERAEFYTLDSQGFLSSKARERAHRHAVVSNDLFEEFNEDACRLIEKAMGEAVRDYPDELRRLWREQASR